jgi:hypothetical protein
MGIWFKAPIKMAYFYDHESHELGTFKILRPCCFRAAKCSRISQKESIQACERQQWEEEKEKEERRRRRKRKKRRKRRRRRRRVKNFCGI